MQIYEKYNIKIVGTYVLQKDGIYHYMPVNCAITSRHTMVVSTDGMYTDCYINIQLDDQDSRVPIYLMAQGLSILGFEDINISQIRLINIEMEEKKGKEVDAYA